RGHANGALEPNSLYTIEIHMRHFRKTLGERFQAVRLKQIDIQTHVPRRLKQKGIHGRKISPATVRKEVASFRDVWNWAVRAELLTGPFPGCPPVSCARGRVRRCISCGDYRLRQQSRAIANAHEEHGEVTEW